ncbi:MAG: hypothetical protein JWQ35_2044, partial [Bacteriovoracaceae bacterium]|nr:hypothetical protein [Bacteriovoracaceae bacterium]
MKNAQFCEVSSLWIPSSDEKSPIRAHEGAFGALQWKRFFSKKKKLFIDYLVFIPPILILIFLIPYFSAEKEAWIDATLLYLSVFYLIMITLPIHISSAWNARSRLLGRLCQLDFWIGLFLLFSAIEYFFTWQDGKPQFKEPSDPMPIVILSLGSFLWLQIKSSEALLWKRHFKGTFKDKNYLWPQFGTPDREVLKWEVLLFVFGVLLVSAVVVGLHLSPEPSFFIAALIPLTLPQFQWIVSQLLARAERSQFISQKFSQFRKLRKTDLFIIHQCG